MTLGNAEACARWKASHPEAAKAYGVKYRAKHRRELAAATTKYRRGHPEEVKAYNTKYHPEWRAKNRTRWNAYSAKYRLSHLDKAVQHAINYRARCQKASGSHTLVQWQSLLEQHKYRCFWHRRYNNCDLILTKRTATRDHVIPVSRGGSNDISNIVPACQSCNSRKHVTILSENA